MLDESCSEKLMSRETETYWLWLVKMVHEKERQAVNKPLQTPPGLAEGCDLM